MTQEALKLALEALEGVLDDAPKVLDASISGGLYEVVQCREAITAIKEALAQRTWVGLTKDEVTDWDLPEKPTVFEFAKFVEAKLKDKNT